MNLDLSNKRVLVTGASKGIGRAIAQRLAAEGCDLTLVSRGAEALHALADELAARHGVPVRGVAADLSDHAEIERIAAEIGDLDVLVNNAGAIPPGDLFAVDDARWRAAWDLKVFGYIGMSRAFYPRLKASRGAIVNVIGAAGERLNPNYIAGSVGNAALMAFTRTLAKAGARDGVRVVGINPGMVATDRMETLLRDTAQARLGDEAQWATLTDSLPFGRAAAPDEIADAVAFLASARSAYTNGAILTIDGGEA